MRTDWNRARFKETGKTTFLANYWPFVGVLALLLLLSGNAVVYQLNQIDPRRSPQAGSEMLLPSPRVSEARSTALIASSRCCTLRSTSIRGRSMLAARATSPSSWSSTTRRSPATAATSQPVRAGVAGAGRRKGMIDQFEVELGREALDVAGLQGRLEGIAPDVQGSIRIELPDRSSAMAPLPAVPAPPSARVPPATRVPPL